jgi:hypothetical protein
MSHHGREDEREECGSAYRDTAHALRMAISVLQDVASGTWIPVDGRSVAENVDRWLAENGYDCPTTRKNARERRAVELDAEIERLRAERAKL